MSTIIKPRVGIDELQDYKTDVGAALRRDHYSRIAGYTRSDIGLKISVSE